MIQHPKLSASGRRWLRSIAGAFCSLIFAASVATAGVSDPAIDGNGEDLIALAGTIGDAGCGIDIADSRDDISISDDGIIPCSVLEITNGGTNADYYVNGKDLRRFVSVYRTGDAALFLLFRAEGFIGDVDGNGNPDNANCTAPGAPPAASFVDQVGIGSEDSYEAFIDTNCDGDTDFLIVVKNNEVTVNGVVDPTATFAFRENAGLGASGKDLEVRVNGLNLPAGFSIFGFSGAIRDGLGEDVTREGACTVNPNIALDKSVNVASICPGGSADFTLLITNTGDVDLTNVTVVDNLPAGLVYQQTTSNTCGGPVSPVGNTITYGPFDLARGASCTIIIRVGRTAECSGEQVNRAVVEGTFQSACINGGLPLVVSAEDTAALLCGNVQCSIDAPDTRVCGTETVQICGPEGNYSYAWSKNGQPLAEATRCINVGAGTYSLVVTDVATGCASSNPCEVTVEADTPLIEVEKSVSPEGAVEQGTLLTYTLTVTNPAWSTITAENISVTDYLCDETLYAGNANPAPISAPNVGETGTIVWNVGPLAPGTSATITFDASIRELPAPECEATNRSCENRVEVSTSCGGGEPATDEASVTTGIEPCLQQGLCRLTGGGCLNEDGNNRGKKQSTFGGNSSPFHEGGGPTGNSWEHVYRDGREILFNWHSWDAYVTRCSVVEPGPCSPEAVNTRADFQGTGKYSLGAGSREEAGNMVAYIIDHREGACNRNTRDEYYITVRKGLVIGEGEIVFQTGGEIDCGNLQMHETPRWLFSGENGQPGSLNEIESAESIALLNRAVPNPFKASMSYAYEITGGDQPVEIGVYNVAGRMVKSLVSSTMPVGRHTATWNGTDDGGSKVASGVYFVRARYGADMKQQRVIYLWQ